MSINDETECMIGANPILQPTDDRPGDLPGYVLGKEVGRGGMGVVYRARDLGMNREVAVKILLDKFAPDSTTAERFVCEAQITGQLQHPGIPAVYHVGRLADGRPFLAMKLIKGETLNVLLKRGRPPNALAVFEAIAQAVGYAHAHEVIHRDLKPGNVMVGSFGEVQVMDWGLAKVLARGAASRGEEESADPEATTAPTEVRTPQDLDGNFTQFGSVLGTPAFLSPEQAAGEVEKVDRRSDVFGLGAILCTLLTGEPPYSGLEAETVRLAAVRGKTEGAFARLDDCGAEPDVVALCKRCLSFEPADRPADASAVAQEVASLRAAAEDRARQAELARVRAEVKTEEQRKRRRVAQAAAVGVVAVLLCGIAGTTVGLVRADRARREAMANAKRADAAKAQSEANLAETQAVLAFVEDKVFAAARPEGQEGGLGQEVTLKRALYSAVPFVEKGFREQPLIEARLRRTLGISFSYLGEYETARAMYQRSRELYADKLGHDHPDTLMSINSLAAAYAALGRHAEAIALGEQTLRVRQVRLGPDHPDTLKSMNNLAISYAALDRHAEALALGAQTLKLREVKLGPEHPDTLQSMNNLAINYHHLGRHAEALALLEQTLKLREVKLGPDHPDTLKNMYLLAGMLIQVRRGAESIPIIDNCVRLAAGKTVDPRLISRAINLRLRHFETARDAAGCRDTAAMWEQLARTDAGSLYKAACYRAVTAAVLGDSPDADAAADQFASEEADRAMAWLRKAVAAGYKDRGLMEKDKDLDALRSRADFRELVESLPEGPADGSTPGTE
jgi:tetratricopeptide (TPR) repeat protein